jgi:hypothetical protein
MTPAYEGDPDGQKVVPREQWSGTRIARSKERNLTTRHRPVKEREGRRVVARSRIGIALGTFSRWQTLTMARILSHIRD